MHPTCQARTFRYHCIASAYPSRLLISVSGLNPIKALYWSAVINAVISVPIMIAVMVAASRPKLMNDLVLPTP